MKTISTPLNEENLNSITNDFFNDESKAIFMNDFQELAHEDDFQENKLALLEEANLISFYDIDASINFN